MFKSAQTSASPSWSKTKAGYCHLRNINQMCHCICQSLKKDQNCIPQLTENWFRCNTFRVIFQLLKCKRKIYLLEIDFWSDEKKD